MPKPDALARMERILHRLYGIAGGSRALERIATLLERWRPGHQEEKAPRRFSQSDAILITYGDTLLQPGQPPLKTLYGFAHRYLRDSFSGIHVLPFFPFSSDDGFSVTDFQSINPELGTWADLARLRDSFDLMFDFVLNHISAKSQWFSNYLAEVPGYRDLAIEVDPEIDLSRVTRPRALSLLTPFEKESGETVHLWTTFSADQIDLNYQSAEVLCKMVEILLDYVGRGARLIRMDAVAYLWKEIGTSCIHLPQTFDIIRLLRAILDIAAPDTVIITETNVPHQENIAYFGNGTDQAQMVYNFTLPPLLLHSLTSADTRVLSRWAASLSTPSDETTFFNFTASHDGIGVRPLEGILTDSAIGALASEATRSGGAVSYRQNSDGSRSPYELNITYLDALGADPLKFMASQAIQMILPGVPAVYIHSLLGSRNWTAGVAQTGRPRSINRERLALPALLEELERRNSSRHIIFNAYRHMLTVRRAQPAFHPNADFAVLDLGRGVFGARRSAGGQRICALTNVTGEIVSVNLAGCVSGVPAYAMDLLEGTAVSAGGIVLPPYQSCWLEL